MLRSVCFGTKYVCLFVSFPVAGYARSQGKTSVTFGPTDLVCCRTLQGHTGKVSLFYFNLQVANAVNLYFIRFTHV